jgi:hypothetical protein
MELGSITCPCQNIAKREVVDAKTSEGRHFETGSLNALREQTQKHMREKI